MPTSAKTCGIDSVAGAATAVAQEAGEAFKAAEDTVTRAVGEASAQATVQPSWTVVGGIPSRGGGPTVPWSDPTVPSLPREGDWPGTDRAGRAAHRVAEGAREARDVAAADIQWGAGHSVPFAIFLSCSC